ncbi:MAG: DUF433 domain-containing protein [Acidobacteria bacterium]|nr:DUF433 domain-containing protein [Acidobacteriota bacterium]
MSYVEEREGTYRIAGTRISLDSVVYSFRGGQTAETIAQSYPSLSLEQIYGAIAFYLGHKAEIDAYLFAEEADYEAFRKQTHDQDTAFHHRLAAARQQLLAS